MSFNFKLQNSQLICEGEGMSFLRLKTNLKSFLGNGQIITLNPKTFSLSLTSAVAASSIFKDLFGIVPKELAPGVEIYEKHAKAREQAMSGVLENKIEMLEVPWPVILDPAQAIAVSAMITPGLLGLCLFDEQGIGKTLTTIAAFDILRHNGETDCLVVVCPVTMIGGWKKEIEKFLPGKYRIKTLEGSAEEKRKAALSPFDVLICNFESVSPLLVPLKGVLWNKRATLAVDESFNVKNREASRSIAVRTLRGSCIKGFVMCGTPAPNSAVDIINQFDIADDGYTFAGFISSKDEESSAKLISERIEERGAYVRRLKEEVLPFLPEKQFSLISVNMSGRQAALYEEARGKLELVLKSMDNATFKKSLTTYFQQRAALLQICACPEVIDPTFSDVSAKLAALDKLVEEIVEKGGKKLIIWSFYKASLQNLFERYKKFSPVILDGSSSAKKRSEAVNSFQSDSKIRMCIANPAAAGAGITLHSASDAAYVSFSNQAAHFLQSIDRIHRRGQKADSVNYHIIICRGTIEEAEVQRLRDKEARQQELLKDQVKWPSSLDEALSDLAPKIL
jgi:Superfamily II DNA/RNA helicases, SNF2 family